MPQPTYTLATIDTHPALREMEAEARAIVADSIRLGFIEGGDPEEISNAHRKVFALVLAADGEIEGPFSKALAELLWKQLNPTPTIG